MTARITKHDIDTKAGLVNDLLIDAGIGPVLTVYRLNGGTGLIRETEHGSSVILPATTARSVLTFLDGMREVLLMQLRAQLTR